MGIEPPGNSGSRPAIDSHGFRYLIVAIARIGIALLMFFAFDVWSVNFLGTLCIQFAYKVSLFCSIHIMDTTVWFCYTSYTLHNKFIHFAYKVSLFSSIHMDTTFGYVTLHTLCITNSYTLHTKCLSSVITSILDPLLLHTKSIDGTSNSFKIKRGRDNHA